MKEKMWTYFTANSTRVYIDVLDKLVQQYNSTKHASIKAKLQKISIDTHPLQLIKLHHFKLDIFKSI